MGKGTFFGSRPTGFGQHYAAFLDKDLHGIEIGYQVLNHAIINIIMYANTLEWAWSIGIFALMFSECARFVWFSDKLIDARKGSIEMRGQYSFMSLLPTPGFWSQVSRCAKSGPGEFAGPASSSKIYCVRRREFEASSNMG